MQIFLRIEDKPNTQSRGQEYMNSDVSGVLNYKKVAFQYMSQVLKRFVVEFHLLFCII